jgi:hypothetical protein
MPSRKVTSCSSRIRVNGFGRREGAQRRYARQRSMIDSVLHDDNDECEEQDEDLQEQFVQNDDEYQWYDGETDKEQQQHNLDGLTFDHDVNQGEEEMLVEQVTECLQQQRSTSAMSTISNSQDIVGKCVAKI